MADFADLQDMSPLLKAVYLPVRKKVFPLMTPALAAAQKAGPDRVRYSGEDLHFLVKLGRRPGFVSSAQGFLPESGLAKERKGRLGIARSYFVVQVDGLNAHATADKRGSYLSASKKLVEDVMDQWELEQARVVHGDSLGVRAKVVSKTSDTVWVVDSPYGISGAGPGSLLLEEGDTVALLDVSAANAVLGKGKITNIGTVTSTQATITVDTDLDGGGTGAAGDLIVTAVPTSVDASDSSFGAEPHGFMSFVDVEAAFATFENINDSRWVAQKLTSATVDETILMKLLNTIRSRAGVDWRRKPDELMIITTTGIWTKYGNSLLGIRRFAAPEMTMAGGFTATKVGGAGLLDDPWAPRGRIYAIHGPSTIFVDLMEFGQISFQDAPKWQRASNRDAWEAVYGIYWNYGLTNRSAMGVLSGITDADNFSPIY